MTPELEEYLRIIEMKLLGLIRDIQNIRNRVIPNQHGNQPTFFSALPVGEDINQNFANHVRREQCPHN